MNVEQTCRVLLLSKNHVQCLAREGEIKAKKQGRSWVFDDADVLRWKRERPGRKPQDHPWRRGMILGRQNWRCAKCRTLNTRRDECSKCGTRKKGKHCGNEQERATATGRRD